MLKTSRIPVRNIAIFLQNIGLAVPDLIARCSIKDKPVSRDALKRCFNEAVILVSEYEVQLFFENEAFYLDPDECVIIQYHPAVLTKKNACKEVQQVKEKGCVSIW